MIEVQEFITRRNKLYDKLQDNSVLILFAGVSVKRRADETYPFTINKNFSMENFLKKWSYLKSNSILHFIPIYLIE